MVAMFLGLHVTRQYPYQPGKSETFDETSKRRKTARQRGLSPVGLVAIVLRGYKPSVSQFVPPFAQCQGLLSLHFVPKGLLPNLPTEF